MLQRTQIILDTTLKSQLELLAKQENSSVSAVVRKLLKTQLKREKKHTQANLNKQYGFLEKLAKNAIKGPSDSEYDKYAYDL